MFLWRYQTDIPEVDIFVQLFSRVWEAAKEVPAHCLSPVLADDEGIVPD